MRGLIFAVKIIAKILGQQKPQKLIPAKIKNGPSAKILISFFAYTFRSLISVPLLIFRKISTTSRIFQPHCILFYKKYACFKTITLYILSKMNPCENLFYPYPQNIIPAKILFYKDPQKLIPAKILDQQNPKKHKIREN